MTCERCHADLRLADKYGLSTDKVASYEDSYHGLAARSGAVTMAHCASCHGVHDILPSSDPRSHVHQENLATTCGQCHPGAGETFAISEVHILSTEPEHAAIYFVRWMYLWMIYLVVGGMILHNLLDLVRKVRTPHPPILGAEEEPEERMIFGFRLAHALMLTSFAVLVYTGFALKYPEAWWARPVLQWEESFGFRGGLHRGAAVLMLGALGVHFAHLFLERRAWKCIAGMRPTWEDWIEFRERMSWYLGRRPTPPHTPRLGYPEKMEYIALMWGMVVMAVTGFLLWYENAVLRWLPKLVTDVATVVHFYEAILATLAIVVWHFYFVIFDPVVYPMDTAWLTGRSHAGRALERRHASPAGPGRAPSSGPRPAAPSAKPPPPRPPAANPRVDRPAPEPAHAKR
jgi:Ni,Fe-hydrogenase I cytochrome b subunit